LFFHFLEKKSLIENGSAYVGDGVLLSVNKKIFFSEFCSSYFLDSPPSSEIAFVMEKLGGNTKENNDFESGNNQPKKFQRRHLLHNFFDFLAIATSKSNKELIFVFFFFKFLLL
jgi:hypothetical protein